jgi:primosomal protein N' (replication factor Y)
MLSAEFKISIDLDKYTSENSIISNRKTITNIISSKNLQIILSTRSGIFLPFKGLLQTLLIEESSNNYIQEQNSLYFDCRDISYILSQIWGSNLDWVSHLPSSRSLAFNQIKEGKILKQAQEDTINVEASLPHYNLATAHRINLQIFEKNSLFDDNHIFSAATEELIEESTGPILLIHPRRGNFRVTQCQDCRYIWQCPNCTAALTTYKNSFKKLELLCHHCQSKVEYPLSCPECKGTEVSSYSSGIDDLYENLSLTYPDKKIFKIDTSTSKQFKAFLSDLELYSDESPIFLTTKVFDPRIPYSHFKSIVFIQAQNLAVGLDYLTTEEIILSVFNLYIRAGQSDLGKILNQVQDDTTIDKLSKPQSPISIIFDTTNPDLEILQKFTELNSDSLDKSKSFEDLLALYIDNVRRELVIREKFHLPPYHNLLLLSLNGKNLDKLKENVFTLYKWLKSATKELQPELELTPPYTAKLLKRKGFYTYHLLLKYPKNFKHIKDLGKILKPVIADMHIQARLNPRHIF